MGVCAEYSEPEVSVFLEVAVDVVEVAWWDKRFLYTHSFVEWGTVLILLYST